MFDIIKKNEWENERGRKEINYDVFYNGIKIGYITGFTPSIGYSRGDYEYADYLRYEYTLYTKYDREDNTYYNIRSFNKEYKTLFEAKSKMLEKFKEEGLSEESYKKPHQKVDIRLLTAGENTEFYPTPSKIAGEMLAGIKDYDMISSILEPSAGKGDLIEALKTRNQKGKGRYRRDLDIDCIEKDENLRYLLEGKGYRVVFDDFLRFHTTKKYQLILMNPPFSEGATHLLKAIDMQKNGGKVCCLLNAETLRNPYTNERKVLLQQLSKYSAKVKYIEKAFGKAERRTNVAVAIVWVDIPYNYGSSVLLDGLEKAKEEDIRYKEVTDICLGDKLEGMVQRFETECKLCRELLREYEAVKPYILRSVKTVAGYNPPVIELKINGHSDGNINDVIRSLRYKYWREMMENEELMSRFTSTLREKYRDLIDDMSEYDFNSFNVKKVLLRMNAEIVGGIEEELYKVFDKMSEQHSWYPECGGNIHYYNGWATNKAHKVGMKVILPTYGVFSDSSWCRDTFSVNEAYKSIADIEKVFNYLDGAITEEVNLERTLNIANNCGITKNIHCKYFDVTFYKKGTVHIKMHPETQRIIDALNIYVARGRKWLPPHYGKAKYEDMDEKSQQVIDEFQGKDEYSKVLENPTHYLYEVSSESLMALPG